MRKWFDLHTKANSCSVLALRGNMGLSAVCAYNMTSVDEVFSKGKYMQKAMVEQSHTKWVQYNGITPSPRPGAVRIPIYRSP